MRVTYLLLQVSGSIFSLDSDHAFIVQKFNFVMSWRKIVSQVQILKKVSNFLIVKKAMRPKLENFPNINEI